MESCQTTTSRRAPTAKYGIPQSQPLTARETAAKRRINAGEELTYNYGLGLEGYEENLCNCGASTCVGFMVDEQYFATVRRRHDKSGR